MQLAEDRFLRRPNDSGFLDGWDMKIAGNKITPGYVTQAFDENGNCTGQEFIAGEEETWENEFGDELEDEPDYEHPLEMVQPGPLTFEWTAKDVIMAAEILEISVTEEQAIQLFKEHADELAEIEGAAVRQALVDIIGETFPPDKDDIMSREEVRQLNERLQEGRDNG